MSENQNKMVENKDLSRYESFKKEEKTQGVRAESTCDFTLPDYMGDIKKLLKCSADCIPCNKFIGTDEISFLGTVNYRVMYLDSEDRITEAAFSSEYEHTARRADNVIDAEIDARIQNLSVRLGGPRKISARASLVLDISAQVGCAIARDVIPEGAEKYERTVNIHSAVYLPSVEREYAEQIGRLDGVSADEVEVIKCEAEFSVTSEKMIGYDVEVRGEGIIFALLRVGDEIIRMEKRLPYDAQLANESLTGDGGYPSAKIFVTSASVNVNDSGASENIASAAASVVMSVTVECSGRIDMNLPLTVTCDAFVPGKKCESTYETFEYNRLVSMARERKSCTFEVRKSEAEIPELYDICEVDAEVSALERVEREDGTAACATVNFTVIARDKNGDFLSIKLPQEYECEKICASDNPTSIKLNVCAQSAEHDSEKLYLSCDVIETLYSECSEKIPTVSAIYVNDEAEGTGRVTVYYPEERDTLWSVAKKYSVCVADVIKNNSPLELASGKCAGECSLNDLEKVLIIKK